MNESGSAAVFLRLDVLVPPAHARAHGPARRTGMSSRRKTAALPGKVIANMLETGTFA